MKLKGSKEQSSQRERKIKDMADEDQVGRILINPPPVNQTAVITPHEGGALQITNLEVSCSRVGFIVYSQWAVDRGCEYDRHTCMP